MSGGAFRPTLMLLAVLTALGVFADIAGSQSSRTENPTPTRRFDWPRTCDAAAQRTLSKLGKQRRVRFKQLDRRALRGLHRSWGMWLRVNLGIGRGNTALAKSCTGHALAHPDVTAWAVIDKAWLLSKTHGPTTTTGTRQ